jgi:TusA-related sulfurtransferase
MPAVLRLDLAGLFCPEVVLRVARAVRENPHTGIFEILSTDPLSRIDIPVYAARTGLTLAGQAAGEDGVLLFRLVRSGAEAEADAAD